MRSDVGRAGSGRGDETRHDHVGARLESCPSDSAADTDSHESGDSSASSTTPNEASSSYCTSTRSASVADAAIGIADGVAQAGPTAFARSTPASVTSAGARPRSAQNRTSGDGSSR